MTTIAKHYESPPQFTDLAGNRTWITRGANFVVAVTEAIAGATLERSDNEDEYMVLLPAVGAVVTAGDVRMDVDANTLIIVPPGASSVSPKGRGCVVRIFTVRASDLAASAGNAAAYGHGDLEAAPLVYWPAPAEGFRLRTYALDDYSRSDTNMRVFRSTNLMINVLLKRTVARDTSKLSPHSHADFEQCSLALSGTYVHHLRYPWATDMSTWRQDEHIQVGSPSVLVVPPKAIHTSMNVGDDTAWLVDIFSPPRMDFSSRPGLVCNADEYPMPSGD